MIAAHYAAVTNHMRSSLMLFPHRSDHMARMILLILFMALCISPSLQAQPVEPCENQSCRVDSLWLGTGYDHGHNATFGIGGKDNYWTVISDPVPFGPVPRCANVIAKDGVWADPPPNTQWIAATPSAMNDRHDLILFEKCFCVCETDPADYTFELDVMCDDAGRVYIDGIEIGKIENYGAQRPTKFKETRRLRPGMHCIQVRVDNVGAVVSGLLVAGSVTGPGLVSYACCSRRCDAETGCATTKLTLATETKWDILVDAGGEIATHCADTIERNVTWAAIEKAKWIGTRIMDQDSVAVAFRRCFCISKPSTLKLDLRLASTSSYAVTLGRTGTLGKIGIMNNTSVNPAATQSVNVPLTLDSGCYCLNVLLRPRANEYAGMSAIAELTGEGLVRDTCCPCATCLLKSGVEGVDASRRPHAPILLAIPNPASEDLIVRYLLDEPSQVTLELYDASGQLVDRVARGLESRGEHSVTYSARRLPAGAYRLLLRYDTRTTSIALQVK